MSIKFFGQYLIEQGVVDSDQIRAALKLMDQENRSLGELAEAGGILRGLAYTGLQTEAGAKLAEIDPAGDPANCRGIAQRPARIAEGVLAAVREGA